MKQLMQLLSSLLILVILTGICIESSAVHKDLLHRVKATTRDVKCDEGWEEFSGHCYYFPDEYKDWKGARDVCESQKSILVRIESWSENDWIRIRMKTGPSWTGGIRAFHGGFVWYNNNDDFDFTNYQRGEPNNDSGDENCLEIRSDDHGTWNDVDCGFFKHFICKKD